MASAQEREVHMVRKKGKSVSFDAMVKFFMQYYNIPTKKDIEKLVERMDRLENVIKESELYVKGRRISTLTSSKETTSASGSATTSSNMVLEVIKRFNKGVGFSEIQEKTGFGEKKLRNIIYRLHKMKKVARKSRGIYIAS
jgi:predicted secreted Zn-dependent protease